MAPASTPDLLLARAKNLPCWRGAVRFEPLGGGLSNHNLKAQDAAGTWVVRLAGEVPEHGIVRANDIAASRAAAAAGIAPELHHAEADVLVIRYVDGRTLTDADVQNPVTRRRIADLLRRAHGSIGRHLRGPAIMFWVFHALRDYAAQLQGSPDAADLPRLMAIADAMERIVGTVDLVFGHNDLLPANIVDDGDRLWLIDWEYAGYNSALFDLGNLASNAKLDEEAWRDLVAVYHGRTPDADLLRRAGAMRVASLLREALWARVAKRHQRIAVDFDAYGAENLARFEVAHQAFLQEPG
jgi:thiamine kinase-like enzyme